MKRVFLALGIVLVGVALIWGAAPSGPMLGDSSRLERAFVLTAGLVLLVIGALIASTAIGQDSRNTALLRLDHFLPFLRKKKKAETLRKESLWVRSARRVLPSSWFADRLTGKPGHIRRLLKWIGPSFLSAPLRRISQASFFMLFLWLFFYVLWPYSASPLPPGKISSGWSLEEIDSLTGHFSFSISGTPLWQPAATDRIYLSDGRALDAQRGNLGAFRVIEASAQRVMLDPAEPLASEHLDALLTSSGTWAIHERSPWPDHYTQELARKEIVPAELFLVIDPLVSLSTAIAARSWVWSLACAGMILIVCVVVPRGFCGYLCPLGTLIDLFDWSVTKRVKRFRVSSDGWWVHIKYYLLAGTLVCALFGVLVSGYVAAIPVITRGMLFLGDPLQSGFMRGWSHLPPLNVGHLVSIGLFFTVLSLGFMQPRFWCKYVCPSGAIFSLGNLFRLTERKVESSCIHCNKCVEICPFDAIKPDFTTRGTDCTLCQTCAGVCPTHAIKFVERWNTVELKVLNDPPTNDTALGRRGFLSLAAGAAAGVVSGAALATTTKVFGARLDAAGTVVPVRPPGSVPEQEFLQMCIRCGECFKACPYNVLQPIGFSQGLEGLWTPEVVADHAGCAPSCNACGQVCPTGAIRALALEEKQVARMGLAIVNEQTCLPHANKEACQLCVDECTAAGYHALEFRQVHTETDDDGFPLEGSGYLAPIVLDDKCVGCGICQMSCYRVNVNRTGALRESAIIIEAGEGKEDRLMTGSYRELRREEARRQRSEQPEFRLQVPPRNPSTLPPADNPFGVPQPEASPFGEGIEAETSPFGSGSEEETP